MRSRRYNSEQSLCHITPHCAVFLFYYLRLNRACH